MTISKINTAGIDSNLSLSGNTSLESLVVSGTVSGTGFSNYLASPPAIGGTTPAAGAFTTLSSTGNATLGDASGDTLTINGTAVSIPNNLNFDSDTLFIDAANNRVGIGTSSPAYKLDVQNDSGVSLISNKGSTGSNYYGWYGSTLITQIQSSITRTLLNSVANVPLQFATNDTVQATIDTSGNLGLGVTPSGWSSAYKVFEIGGGSSGMNIAIGGSQTAALNIYHNAYRDAASTYRYKANGYTEQYQQYNGTHAWFTAPSGTAGNAISFTQAMTLDASGNLLVGTTSGSGDRIYVSGYIRASQGFKTDGGTWIDTPSSESIRLVTNSAERLRIDSSGKVLVNASSGDAYNPLQVQSMLGFATTGGYYSEINNNLYYDGSTGWKNKNQGPASQIVLDGGASQASAIRFNVSPAATSTAADTAISITEAMRINSSGNLLVNLTSGTAKTQIQCDGFVPSNSNVIYPSLMLTGQYGGGIVLNDGGLGCIWMQGGGTIMGFGVGTTSGVSGSLYIKSGNVGIGTNNPDSALHITSSNINNTATTIGIRAGMYAGGYAALEMVSSSGLSGWIDFHDTAGADFSERIRGGIGDLDFYTNGSHKSRINSSGVLYHYNDAYVGTSASYVRKIQKTYDMNMGTYYDGTTYRNYAVRIGRFVSTPTAKLHARIIRHGDYNYNQYVIHEITACRWSASPGVINMAAKEMLGLVGVGQWATDSNGYLYYHDTMLWEQNGYLQIYADEYFEFDFTNYAWDQVSSLPWRSITTTVQGWEVSFGT